MLYNLIFKDVIWNEKGLEEMLTIFVESIWGLGSGDVVQIQLVLKKHGHKILMGTSTSFWSTLDMPIKILCLQVSDLVH